jgi:hypothetical protein
MSTRTFPFLPPGYEARLRVLELAGVRVHCLEIHDLVLSKLVAGRLKDNETIATFIATKLVGVHTIRERIATIPDLDLRAILLARLQLVLENVG